MLRFFNRYLRRKDGATAIEFSLLSIPYFMLTFGIIEISLMMGSAMVLEGGTSKASRMIRTGQIQLASNDPVEQEEMFRERLCQEVSFLINCEAITIESVDISSFGSVSDAAPQFDADGNLISQGFASGGVNDVVLIRTAYRYALLTPMIGNLLGEGGSNSRLFLSTIVLQTEPYEFDPDAGA